MLSGVSFLEATINNTTYRLYAGQDYLNTEYSLSLWETAPTKSGNIKIYEGGQLYPDTALYKCGIVGDAHHRFMWGAKHKQSLTAELVPQPMKQQDIYEWNRLKYKHNPKHEYIFEGAQNSDPLYAGVNEGVKRKLFLAAISPLAPYAGAYEKEPREFISTYLRDFWSQVQKGFVIEEPEMEKFTAYLDNLVSKADVMPYKERVQTLVNQSKNKQIAESMGEMLIESFPSGRTPNVALGATPSVGYYDPASNVIVLDPNKNPTADALLDTLAFETGNALQRKDFLAKKETTTDIEFRTTEGYIDTLMEATGTYSIDALVTALNIPEEYLIPANVEEVLKESLPDLPMPEKAVLPEQKMRSALAWWKMQAWTGEERMQYFATSAHAEGMAATGAEYQDKDKQENEKGASSPPLIEGAHPAEKSLNMVVQAINNAYPKAQDWHWAKLQPRHFGEFLLTGTIKGWNAGKPEETTYSPKLFTAFIRDVEKVYPNVQDFHFENLTYTDVGNFLFKGKIESWETWGKPWSGD